MKILFKISFSVALFLVAIEILLRNLWMLPVTAKGAYLCRDDFADHSHYPYGVGRMKTGEFSVVLRMNNIGMRDDDVEIPKPANRRRILVLGDSFMEGWGCERGEIFTDRLEALLREKNPAAEVVAAGVASWAPLAELAWFRHRGIDLDPDVVLLGIDATDPAGDSFYVHRLVRDAAGRPDYLSPGKRKFDLPKSVHEFLAGHFYTYRYVDRFLTKKFPETEWDYGFWGEHDDVWAPLRSDSEVSQPEYEAYWKSTREALLTLNEICVEKNIPLLIFQYPTGVETDSSAWATGRSTADFGPGMIHPRRFEYLDAMARTDSLPYYGLLAHFKKHPAPAELFYPYDGHWSAKGHGYAAEEIAAELARRQML